MPAMEIRRGEDVADRFIEFKIDIGVREIIVKFDCEDSEDNSRSVKPENMENKDIKKRGHKDIDWM